MGRGYRFSSGHDPVRIAMPYNFAALVLLAASAAFQVQKPTLEQHVNSGCPLILEATRAKSSQGSDPTGSPHQLFLKWPRAHAVIKISGVFHGPALRERTSETASDIVDGAVQVFHFGDGDRTIGSSTYWTGTLAIVRWVELTDVWFLDGSEWHATPSSQCWVEPQDPATPREVH
jgi:hypothetical protein